MAETEVEPYISYTVYSIYCISRAECDCIVAEVDIYMAETEVEP